MNKYYNSLVSWAFLLLMPHCKAQTLPSDMAKSPALCNISYVETIQNTVRLVTAKHCYLYWFERWKGVKDIFITSISNGNFQRLRPNVSLTRHSVSRFLQGNIQWRILTVVGEIYDDTSQLLIPVKLTWSAQYDASTWLAQIDIPYTEYNEILTKSHKQNIWSPRTLSGSPALDKDGWFYGVLIQAENTHSSCKGKPFCTLFIEPYE